MCQASLGSGWPGDEVLSETERGNHFVRQYGVRAVLTRSECLDTEFSGDLRAPATRDQEDISEPPFEADLGCPPLLSTHPPGSRWELLRLHSAPAQLVEWSGRGVTVLELGVCGSIAQSHCAVLSRECAPLWTWHY